MIELPNSRSIFGATMTYKNAEMKLDELLGYFRDGKINLIPPFQRGRVWPLSLRKRLLENIVKGKPIPAIFLYKEASGSKYSYNILDGKQRLESILLFVGNDRDDLAVPNWQHYFFKAPAEVGFKINIATGDDRAKNMKFADLSDELVREFREYPIATIEIDLDKEEGGLKEVIDLFIDINQLGVKVNRFDIVRTMYEKNRLLADVFKLIAIKQRRKKDNFYKLISSDFTAVLKNLQSVDGLGSTKYQEKVDRMWERLLEIVLFVRTKQHRTLAQILKAFLGAKVDDGRISVAEMATLRGLFGFLKSVYRNDIVKTSRLAREQSHFYTMVTSINSLGLIEKYGIQELERKLIAMAAIVSDKQAPPKGKTVIFKEYMTLSSKQTTHPGRRGTRQSHFAEILGVL